MSTDRSRPIVPGLRATRQRAAVASLLEQFADFRSAQELHDELRRRGEDIGLTTVHRTQQSLADAGEIDMLRMDSGEAVCRHRGRTVEVEGPAVERWTSTIAVENGFSEVNHTIEIFGTCAACAG